MAERPDESPEINIRIDERSHEVIPTAGERLVHAVVAVILGYLLVQLIGFWMFPGLGWWALNLLAGWPGLAVVVELKNLLIVTFVAVCGVSGWFRGKYAADRLKEYLDFWKFW